jgi:hypothetical protein
MKSTIIVASLLLIIGCNSQRMEATYANGTMKVSRGTSCSLNGEKAEVTIDGRILLNGDDIGVCGANQRARFRLDETGKLGFIGLSFR